MHMTVKYDLLRSTSKVHPDIVDYINAMRGYSLDEFRPLIRPVGPHLGRSMVQGTPQNLLFLYLVWSGWSRAYPKEIADAALE
jgi:hypothetical protein